MTMAHSLPKSKLSQSFSLSWKLREKAKGSLKVCSYTSLHPFYFHKIKQETEISGSAVFLTFWRDSVLSLSMGKSLAQGCDLPAVLSFYLHLDEIWFLIPALNKGINSVSNYGKRKKQTNLPTTNTVAPQNHATSSRTFCAEPTA